MDNTQGRIGKVPKQSPKFPDALLSGALFSFAIFLALEGHRPYIEPLLRFRNMAARGKSTSSTRHASEADDDKDIKKEQQDVAVWNYSGLLADTLDGFISWTLMTRLPGLFIVGIRTHYKKSEIVFFFPLFKMAFTGWEAATIAYLLSAFVGIAFWRRFAGTARPWSQMTVNASFPCLFTPIGHYCWNYL
jgi:hypothetical protein